MRGVLVLLLVLLAGCAGEPAAVASFVAEGADADSYTFEPSTRADGPAFDPAPAVAWVDGGRYLGVVTMGSSSCPAVPTAVEWDGEVLRVELGERYPDAEVCTADLGPYGVVLEVPAGLDPATETAVEIAGSDGVLPAAT
ncbi:hypothetical protein TEK04_15520 [Klenkia sp. LSe6-5]|uniref:Lipoprotein n=1 Tax=Klenkia sesuvii TaxID=3103137 RepID=A0ABU8DWR0_9ACTN